MGRVDQAQRRARSPQRRATCQRRGRYGALEPPRSLGLLLVLFDNSVVDIRQVLDAADRGHAFVRDECATLGEGLLSNNQNTGRSISRNTLSLRSSGATMCSRINDIRNRVMHPVKKITEYENDYRFVRKLLADFG